jgi:hypothetical protein
MGPSPLVRETATNHSEPMETGEGFEDARTSREARDAVPGRTPGSRSAAIQEALRRYLAVRIYRDRDSDESAPPTVKQRAEEPSDE